jgi:hypothetical protein
MVADRLDPGQRPGRIRDRTELRARESNHGLRVYETRLSAGPPAMESQAPVSSRAAGLMRAGGAPATPEPGNRSRWSAIGESEEPDLRNLSSPEGIRTPFSTLRGWRPGQ